MAKLFFQTDWGAGGHELATSWRVIAVEVALVALVLVYAALIVRALVRRRWYRAQGVLTEADLQALHAELAAVERRTVGEIVPVVLERSDAHPGACWLAALSFVLLGSAAFVSLLTWDRPVLLIIAQLELGALGYLTARALPDFQRLFITEARAKEMAEEQAFQEFHRYGLHRTEGRTGVLLFVSLLERRAIVLADEGIDARVGHEPWARTNDAVLAGIRAGSLRAGLLAGIRSAGELLAQHFPVQEGDRNEVPDRIVIRGE